MSAMPGGPQANPLNFISKQAKDDRFLEAYVESDQLLADLFDSFTGTQLTDSDPPERVRTPSARATMNVKGALALKNYLRLTAADKNNILSNYSEERVMRLCRLKTAEIMYHLIVMSEEYEINLVNDLTLVCDMCFSTMESSLRRAIGRKGADDVSKVSSEATQRYEYSGGVNMGQQGQPQQQQQKRPWYRPF